MVDVAREALDALVADGELGGYEMVLVDDASTDGIEEAARRAGRRRSPHSWSSTTSATAGWAARSVRVSAPPPATSCSTPTPIFRSTCARPGGSCASCARIRPTC